MLRGRVKGTMKSAIVTGGALGIGLGCVRALAKAGYAVTILDLDEVAGREAVREAQALGSPACTFSLLDVTDFSRVKGAFERHVQRYGGLDTAILNAGIGGETGTLDGKGWDRIVQVNLSAQMEGGRLAALHGAGAIVLVASFGSVFPMPFAPAYAASKAGAAHFVRSMAANEEVRERGCRILAICPSYVDTPMVRKGMRASPSFKKHVLDVTRGKLLDIDTLGGVILKSLQDPRMHGQSLMVTSNATGGPPRMFTVGASPLKPYLPPPSSPELVPSSAWAGSRASHYKKLEVWKLSDQYDEAVRIVSKPMPRGDQIAEGHVLIKRLYCGVNASDVNFSAGRYFGERRAKAMLPFGAGFESVGVVVEKGKGVKMELGTPVATLEYGSFSEYGVQKASRCLRIPEASKEMVALLTSGFTASIALEVAGLKGRKTVLVTAAAGGTGQFAVQLAKIAGKHVIATCGSREKAELLRSLGADRIVQYKGPNKEDLAQVLKREYRNGVDLVYDGVGGEMFDVAVSNLAVRGKVLVIGQIGGGTYTSGWQQSMHAGVNEKLLWKGASVEGFFLLHHAKRFQGALTQLAALTRSGQLKVAVDPVEFRSLEDVARAVAHLHSGRSRGKVVVDLTAAAQVKL